MEAVFRLMTKAAGSTIAVLIQGETGHRQGAGGARASTPSSPRGRGPFLAVNCAAMPETLLESQLFGHRRGVVHRRRPRPRRASSRRRPAARCSSTRSARCRSRCRRSCCACSRRARSRRSATPQPRPVDVRVVSATNRDLSARGRRSAASARTSSTGSRASRSRCRRCASGARTSRCWSSASSAQAAHAHRKRIAGITAEALDCLARFDWPGNVRELQNEVQRAVVLAEHGEALSASSTCRRGCAATGAGARRRCEHRRRATPSPRPGSRRGCSCARRAPRSRRSTSPTCCGSRAATSHAPAGSLGLSRMQLHRKLKEYGIR